MKKIPIANLPACPRCGHDVWEECGEYSDNVPALPSGIHVPTSQELDGKTQYLFMCKKCDYKFPFWHKYKAEYDSSYNSNFPPYGKLGEKWKCLDCKEIFRRQGILAHWTNTHNITSKRYWKQNLPKDKKRTIMVGTSITPNLMKLLENRMEGSKLSKGKIIFNALEAYLNPQLK